MNLGSLWSFGNVVALVIVIRVLQIENFPGQSLMMICNCKSPVSPSSNLNSHLTKSQLMASH